MRKNITSCTRFDFKSGSCGGEYDKEIISRRSLLYLSRSNFILAFLPSHIQSYFKDILAHKSMNFYHNTWLFARELHSWFLHFQIKETYSSLIDRYPDAYLFVIVSKNRNISSSVKTQLQRMLKLTISMSFSNIR